MLLKCKLKNPKLLIQLISSLQEKNFEMYLENLKMNYNCYKNQILEVLIKILNLIVHLKSNYFKFNYSIDKLLELCEINFDDDYGELKRDIEKIIDIIYYFFNDGIKLDKFIVQFLIIKHKSGFVLNIKCDGLTNIANELLKQNKINNIEVNKNI